MLTITFAPGDAPLAARLQADLQAALGDQDTEPVAVIILSPEAIQDKGVQRTMNEALDQGKHVIPVLAKPMQLPRLIDHLEAINFSQEYRLDVLVDRIIFLSGPHAGLPLRVRTPAVRAANRRAGYIVATVAVIMFVVGLYLVGVMGVQAPPEELRADQQTETAQVQEIINRYLPRSTEDALNFPSTLEAAPTRLRPLLSDAATATVTQSASE